MIKIILLLALVAFASARTFNIKLEDLSRQVNDEATVRHLNSVQKSWIAGHNPEFEGKTLADAKARLGAFGVKRRGPHPLNVLGGSSSFDSRQQWPNVPAVSNILNQAQCGSCWAFGTSESLSSRLGIQSNVMVQLSPQTLVSCDNQCYGCQGGFLNYAWQYMQNSGIPSLQCQSYQSGGGNVPPCAQSCDDGSSATLHHAKSNYAVSSQVAAIQKEIETNGPVSAAFSVYSDFMNYQGGVYQHTSGSLLGGHAIRILGWGEQNGTPYWIVANSWGTSWGLNGYFYILRGQDECGIESNVYAGMAGQ